MTLITAGMGAVLKSIKTLAKSKKFPGPKSYITEDYIQETADIYKSKAKTKKEYKADK